MKVRSAGPDVAGPARPWFLSSEDEVSVHHDDAADELPRVHHRRSATLPGFRLSMGARVRELVEEDGVVRVSVTTKARMGGARCGRCSLWAPMGAGPAEASGWLRAPKDLAADGRPLVQAAAGGGDRRRDGTRRAGTLRSPRTAMSTGRPATSLTRDLPRAAPRGIGALRRSFAQLVPGCGSRRASGGLEAGITCSVESSRCPQWYKPGCSLSRTPPT